MLVAKNHINSNCIVISTVSTVSHPNSSHNFYMVFFAAESFLAINIAGFDFP